MFIVTISDIFTLILVGIGILVIAGFLISGIVSHLQIKRIEKTKSDAQKLEQEYFRLGIKSKIPNKEVTSFEVKQKLGREAYDDIVAIGKSIYEKQNTQPQKKNSISSAIVLTIIIIIAIIVVRKINTEKWSYYTLVGVGEYSLSVSEYPSLESCKSALASKALEPNAGNGCAKNCAWHIDTMYTLDSKTLYDSCSEVEFY